MKSKWLFAPYGVLLVTSLIHLSMNSLNDHGPLVWSFLLSFVASLGCIPLVSKQNLSLGYLALLFLLAVFIAFTSTSEPEVKIEVSSELEWNPADTMPNVDEFAKQLRRYEVEEAAKLPEPTADESTTDDD